MLLHPVILCSVVELCIVNRCRRLYWNYLWNHPVHVALPPRAIEDASDALTWFYVSLSRIFISVPFLDHKQ